MSGLSDILVSAIGALCLLIAVLGGLVIGTRLNRHTVVSMTNYTDAPQTIVMSPTSAWEKDKGLLILGPEYEIRVFDRRTGREAFK